MDREELLRFLIESVAQTYHADAADLSESTNLTETFGTNSLQRMALCSLIENETETMISLGDIGKYPTIGDIADLILENE